MSIDLPEVTIDLDTDSATVSVQHPQVIIGIPGQQGPPGADGAPGAPGADGADGADGTGDLSGYLLTKNNPNIALDADDETLGVWAIADGGTPTGGWPNRGGFSFAPSGGGEVIDTFQWNEYGEVRCIAAKTTTVGLRVFVKQFASSTAHTANVFEVQDDRTNRNVLVAIDPLGKITARNVDRKVVTFPTGSEPSTVGQPDGTLWVEYTP